MKNSIKVLGLTVTKPGISVATLLLSALLLQGCSGHSHNFKNEFSLSEPVKNPQRCSIKPETGPCKAAFAKYYYNSNTQRCEQFIWGGCEGSVPFENKTSCHLSCEH